MKAWLIRNVSMWRDVDSTRSQVGLVVTARGVTVLARRRVYRLRWKD